MKTQEVNEIPCCSEVMQYIVDYLLLNKHKVDLYCSVV